jgi:hypothetical protein
MKLELKEKLVWTYTHFSEQVSSFHEFERLSHDSLSHQDTIVAVHWLGLKQVSNYS